MCKHFVSTIIIEYKSYFHLEKPFISCILDSHRENSTGCHGVDTQELSLSLSGGGQALQLPEVVLTEAASSPHSEGLWGSCSQTAG